MVKYTTRQIHKLPSLKLNPPLILVSKLTQCPNPQVVGKNNFAVIKYTDIPAVFYQRILLLRSFSLLRRSLLRFLFVVDDAGRLLHRYVGLMRRDARRYRFRQHAPLTERQISFVIFRMFLDAI